MPVEEIKTAFDNICRVLSITKYDIELHQSINDQSLNIHGENYFRDLINDLYNSNYENTNFHLSNFPYIDLADDKGKKAIQITTTTTKAKVIKTLSVLTIGKYSNYDIKLLYMIKKPKFNSKVISEIESKYPIKLKSTLLDITDITKKIHDLPESKIISLNEKYFKGIGEKYTDKIELNLVVRHLLKNKKHIKRSYDDDFGTIETDRKLELNKLSQRLCNEINRGLDYRVLLTKLDNDGLLLQSLKDFVINELYREILVNKLSKTVPDIDHKTTQEIHKIACKSYIDFNKIIFLLQQKIESYMDVNDFNTNHICWIIIAFFFELCDIGKHNDIA